MLKFKCFKSVHPVVCAQFKQIMKHDFGTQLQMKQGRIHGKTVADGWAGAVMQKPPGIQKCDGTTDQPTQQGVESRIRD